MGLLINRSLDRLGAAAESSFISSETLKSSADNEHSGSRITFSDIASLAYINAEQQI